MGQFLVNRAREADALKTAMEAEPEGPRKRLLAAQYAEAAKWVSDGQHRLIITAIGAAAGGNVTGGATQFVQSAAVNYLQGLGASKIKEISRSLGGEGSPGHIALHAVLACSGAAAQGANCGAGAVGASASIVVNSLLQKISGKDSEKLGAEDKDQRANQLVSIIAGIASALTPEQAATIANAARLEAENNTLRDHTQVHSARFDDKVNALADCVGERSCQTAVGHFEGWIRVIDERDLPACGGEGICIQNRLAERDAYTAGLATAIGRLKDPLIAGMDLLDARNKGLYDRLTLKDALVRFRSGEPDYTREVDRFVVEAMMSSPVVFAAVKGLSALDSDGGGGGARPGKTGGKGGPGGSKEIEETSGSIAGHTLNGQTTGQKIQFGRVDNQTNHTFRHVEAAGFQREVVGRAIQKDLSKAGVNLKDGPYAGFVIVNGIRLEYSAFKFPDGTINVGRITPPKVLR